MNRAATTLAMTLLSLVIVQPSSAQDFWSDYIQDGSEPALQSDSQGGCTAVIVPGTVTTIVEGSATLANAQAPAASVSAPHSIAVPALTPASSEAVAARQIGAPAAEVVFVLDTVSARCGDLQRQLARAISNKAVDPGVAQNFSAQVNNIGAAATAGKTSAQTMEQALTLARSLDALSGSIASTLNTPLLEPLTYIDSVSGMTRFLPQHVVSAPKADGGDSIDSETEKLQSAIEDALKSGAITPAQADAFRAELHRSLHAQLSALTRLSNRVKAATQRKRSAVSQR